MTRVKTCGLKDTASVCAAVAAGADYLGFIDFPKSPRHIGWNSAKSLIEDMPRGAKSVRVLVDPDDASLAPLAESAALDFIQLHGAETPGRVAQISRLTAKPIIKALSVRTGQDVITAQAYLPHVFALLFDAKPPEGAALPGGNGISFDWTILDQAWLRDQFWFLSGGLDPQNIAQAVQLTGALAVDVSSGIEARPGFKDHTKISAFITAAKQAVNAA